MTALVGNSSHDKAGGAGGSNRAVFSWATGGETAVASGTATKAFIVIGAGAVAGRKCKVLIYDTAGTSLLGSSAEYTQTGSESNTTVELAVSPGVTITSGTKYKLAIYMDSTVAYRALTSGTGTDVETGGTYPTAPAAITGDTSLGGEIPTVWLEDAGTTPPTLMGACCY